MRRVGLVQDRQHTRRAERHAERGRPQPLALTKRLTGVRVTEELLREAEYRPGEPAEEWPRVVIDITDTNGKRTYVQIDRDQL